MSMDWKDRGQKTEWMRLVKSFSYAMNGLKNAIAKERNLQIHLAISVLVFLFAFYFDISRVEWIILISLIGGMVTLELVNTAIERLVDLVTKEFHPLAKLAKDISAAAVLTFAFTSVIVGLLIFWPYFSQLL
jgi:undecaprenol kinase